MHGGATEAEPRVPHMLKASTNRGFKNFIAIEFSIFKKIMSN